MGSVATIISANVSEKRALNAGDPQCHEGQKQCSELLTHSVLKVGPDGPPAAGLLSGPWMDYGAWG